MTFLHPLLLLAGLGVALPILAHLLNRYRVKRTPWAAMQFLNRSVRVRSRQLRLRDLLLLLLRGSARTRRAHCCFLHDISLTIF